jgi:hypothetical protein
MALHDYIFLFFCLRNPTRQRALLNFNCLKVVNTMVHGAKSHGIAAAVFDDC